MGINLSGNIIDFPKGVPKIPGFIVFSPRLTKENSDALNKENLCGAALGLDRKISLQRAISEAVERFSGYCFKTTQFQYNTYKKIKKNSLNPKSFVFYDKKQYKLNKYLHGNSNETIAWVKGSEIGKSAAINIPAALIYPAFNKSPSKKFDNYTTTGLAASKILEDAIVNGLCEVLERDSIMCAWLSEKGFHRVSLAFFYSPSINKLKKIIEKRGYKIEVFIIPNDFGMVTMVVILKSPKPPYYSFGSCCKLNHILALQRAMEEAIMILRTQRILIDKGYNKKGANDLIGHIMSTLQKDVRFKVHRLIDQKIIKKEQLVAIIEHTPPLLKNLLDRMSKAGYKAYYVDVTANAVRKSGYRVVKVVVPGLHPLETNQNMLHLDLRRVRVFSRNKNLKKICLIPHPFG